MLPLFAIPRPMVTGISAREKNHKFCSMPPSETLKFPSRKSATNWPRSSETVTCSTTSSVFWMIFFGPFSCPGVGGGGGRGVGARIGGGFCAQAGELAHTTTTAKNKTFITKTGRALMPRREISALSGNGERWHSFRRVEPDFNFAPFAVVRPLAWPISKNILIAQLHAYFCSDIGQLAHVFHREHAAAGHHRQIAQKSGAFPFLRRGASIRIEQSDGINLDVRLSYELADFRLAVPTMIISPVR